MTISNISYLPKMDSFTVLDESNTATVTLSDPRPDCWDVHEICTLADPRAIAGAVLDYAVRRCLPPSSVEVSIIWPEDTATDLPTDLAFLRQQAD